MYLPQDLFALPYKQLVASRHASSPPVLLLVALEPDALCACRILTSILKRDYVAHNIVPVAGYGDLERAGLKHVQPMRTQNGGSGGTVICLGTGGMVDLTAILGFGDDNDADGDGDGINDAGSEEAMGGVDIWVVDARRPWNLGNVFGGRPSDSNVLSEISGNARKKMPEIERGKIQHNYRLGRGGVLVFDNGDIDQLEKERNSYFELEQMPDIEDDGNESDGSESDSEDDAQAETGQKRKSWSGEDEDEDEDEEDSRPRQRRRSNSHESIPVTPTRERGFHSSDTLVPNSQASPAGSTSTIAPPSGQQEAESRASMRTQRKRFLRQKRAHEAVLHDYYSRGCSYSEPISSMLYRLASDLGHADNDALWLTCVGVTSVEQYGRGSRRQAQSDQLKHSFLSNDELVLSVLRDEVRRLNPPDPQVNGHYDASDSPLPTNARSPNDTSIRLSPEPRLLLLRHWSLYESMLHSPYLAARLHLWSEPGRKRLHKLLAKMGVSLANARQSYVHMDVEAKRNLRSKLLKYAPIYGLEGLVPPSGGREGWGFVRSWGWKACLSASDVATIIGAILEVGKTGVRRHKRSASTGTPYTDVEGRLEGEEYVERFWDAYDGLGHVSNLLDSLTSTMNVHRAILRTGTSLISKRQIRHLRAFRMAVVKEGPDVTLFTHPGALIKLALWLSEAIQAQEKDTGYGGRGPTPLVLASLNESRGIYVVVGIGGGGGVMDFEDRKARKERADTRQKKKEEKAQEKQRRKLEKEAAREARRVEREDEEDELDEDLETESEASSSEDEDEDDDDAEKGSLGMMKQRNNRFGVAFQEVVDEVGATTRIDNFENCVIEVRKDDLQSFLEALSMKTVIG